MTLQLFKQSFFIHKLRWARYPASLVLLFTFCVSASASTFDNYLGRVGQAVIALDALYQSDETEEEEQQNNRIEQTLAAVRSSLPETETVEWANEEFVVQNKWLHEALDDYQQKSGHEAAAILQSVTERLKALEQRLSETKAARESSGISGDAASSKLKEILQRPEFSTTQKAGNALEQLLRDILRWLSKLIPKRRELSQGSANLATLVAQIVVIAVALAVIVYVVWKVLTRFLRGRTKRKRFKAEPRIVLGEKLAPDQSAGDILAEAEALAKQGDIRAAIRKAYIALIVELGERKVISLAQYKTNRDYLRSVRKIEPLYGTMKTLTDSFERHWYGFVGATQNDWTAFRDAYKRALAR